MLANACGLAGLAGLAGWAYALVPSTCQLMPTQASMHNFATANHLLLLRTRFCYTQYVDALCILYQTSLNRTGHTLYRPVTTHASTTQKTHKTQPHKAQKGVATWGSGGQSQTVKDNTGRAERKNGAERIVVALVVAILDVAPSILRHHQHHGSMSASQIPNSCWPLSASMHHRVRSGRLDRATWPAEHHADDRRQRGAADRAMGQLEPTNPTSEPASSPTRPTRKPPKWKHKWKTALGPGCGSPKSASDWGWGRLRTSVIIRSMSLL